MSDRCPHCLQRIAPRRRRQIHKTMALGLLQFYRHVDGDTSKAVYTPAAIDADYLWRDFAKLRHWGLIAPEASLAVWRITDLGVQFASDEVRVSKYLWLWQNEVVEASDELVRIRETLGEGFDYDGLFVPNHLEP